ncbi:MAG: serine hydrolase [Planctomycetota bacterium]|nr:serine hydrolase [Planctomycetota bacterium]
MPNRTMTPALVGLVAGVAFCLAGARPAGAVLPVTGTYVPQLQAVDTLMQNFMAGKPIPGGTIAITHNNKVVYERGFGYTDAAGGSKPMQENALMRLASVSKPVTASAVQQLIKDGQLSLNAKVFNLSGNGGVLNVSPYNGTLGDARLRDITVGELLAHQGGWNRDVAGDLAFRDVSIANAMGLPSPPGIAASARYILSQPLQFTPGTATSYSNIGFMFLGMVVEAVSGQGYESYVDSKVLAPAGIPAWEINAGRTFAANQDPREPVYSSPYLAQNVYNPTGPSVSSPYGGWDHEKAMAYGGLIGSAKAIATLAQRRIAYGPEIGKLRSDYTTYTNYWWAHEGSLDGTDTLMLQYQSGASNWTYSVLFDRRPTDGTVYTDSLISPLQSILGGLTAWPAPLSYAGDLSNDQWLTQDDVTLFRRAETLTSTAFGAAYPGGRYLAGDFNGDAAVTAADSPGFIAALQHAGAPADIIALVTASTIPGDFNRDGEVGPEDFGILKDHFGLEGLAHGNQESWTLGDANDDGEIGPEDFGLLKDHFGESGGLVGTYPLASLPEPATLFAIFAAALPMLLKRRPMTGVSRR